MYRLDMQCVFGVPRRGVQSYWPWESLLLGLIKVLLECTVASRRCYQSTLE